MAKIGPKDWLLGWLIPDGNNTAGIQAVSLVTSAGVEANPTIGSTSMATGQVTVGTGNTLIAAARAGRRSILITMVGNGDIYIGNTGVTAGTGQLLVGTKGASISLDTAAAVYGIGAVAQAVSYVELY